MRRIRLSLLPRLRRLNLLLCAGLLGGAVPALAAEVEPDLPAAPTAPASQPLMAVQRTHASRFTVPVEDAADIAKAVLPYAALATEVYCYLRSDNTRPFSERSEEQCPSPSLHTRDGWQRLEVYPTTDLPAKDSGSDRGLRFAVYYRDEGPDQPVLLAIAFRGTEFSSWTDWHSNLHWFLPGRDQYQVLRDITQAVIGRSKQQVLQRLARPVSDWRIVTTGHSLGGGLAQMMAYKTRDIAAAVVFDPSPVTGFYTCVEDHEVHCNVPVWRIYARGEVLAYVRALLRKAYDLSENITEIEFDGVRGNPIHKHSMPAFYDLLDRARDQVPASSWPVSRLFAAGGDCQCMALRQQESWQQHQTRCASTWAALAPRWIDWQRAREDTVFADTLAQRLRRLPPALAPALAPAPTAPLQLSQQ